MDDKAKETFNQMDIRYTNYFQRLEFAKYMDFIEERELSKELLLQMVEEIKSMSSYERKLKRKAFKRIQSYLAERKN